MIHLNETLLKTALKLANRSKIFGDDLELKTLMKLCAGRLFKQSSVPIWRPQSDPHDQRLVGLQETCTEFGLSSRFKNCRYGHQIISTYSDIQELKYWF